MRYTSKTLSDSRDAVRELVFRPIYPGHESGLDHAMFSRRLATATVLLAFLGAACGGHSGTKVAAGDETVSPAAAVEATTTTTVTTLPPETTVVPDTRPEPATPPAPVNAKPAPASIEVDYQPPEGAVATATLTGPNGSHSKSLASGAAIFTSLPEGTYNVTVRVDPPSDDPTISAVYYLNGNSLDVGQGDHGTVTCDDNGCTGVLGG